MHTHAQHRPPAMSLEARADVTDVIDSIRAISRSLRISGRASEQRLGISSAQLFILQALRDQPDLSINELADLTFTHQSSVSMVVTRLVSHKLVSRKSASKDGRRVIVALTPAGRAMLKKPPEAGQARLISALKAMPRAELAALAGNLMALTEMVEVQSPESVIREA